MKPMTYNVIWADRTNDRWVVSNEVIIVEDDESVWDVIMSREIVDKIAMISVSPIKI